LIRSGIAGYNTRNDLYEHLSEEQTIIAGLITVDPLPKLLNRPLQKSLDCHFFLVYTGGNILPPVETGTTLLMGEESPDHLPPQVDRGLGNLRRVVGRDGYPPIGPAGTWCGDTQHRQIPLGRGTTSNIWIETVQKSTIEPTVYSQAGRDEWNGSGGAECLQEVGIIPKNRDCRRNTPQAGRSDKQSMGTECKRVRWE